MTTLNDKVVVITGASSGIGRTAARLFAERGAHVVLAARDSEALGAAAADCAAHGVRALAVPTDVTDAAAIDALVEVTLNELGTIDVWVNDAGVYLLGPFVEVPLEVHHQVIAVNILGVIHGMRAALGYFQLRGYGTVINVAALAGRAPYALASTYCGSKAAVRAITEAVRQELAGSRVRVCMVSPAAVDTPLFQHGANYSGRELRPLPPVYDVERVARAIVRQAERPRRERSPGATPVLAALLHALVTPLYERLLPRMIRRQHLGKGPAAAAPGNLFAPHPPHAESGGWKRIRPYFAVGALAATGLALAWRRRARALHA